MASVDEKQRHEKKAGTHHRDVQVLPTYVLGLRDFVHDLARSMTMKDEEVEGNGELLKLVPWPPGLPLPVPDKVDEEKLMALNRPIWNIAKRYCDGEFDPALCRQS